MQVSAEDLERHYASMSDDELLGIDPADLTAIARKCYERQIEKRGLAGQNEQELAEQAYRDVTATRAGLEIEPDWLSNAECAYECNAIPGTDYTANLAGAQDALLAAGIPCHPSVTPSEPEEPQPRTFDVCRILVPHALMLKALSVIEKQIFNVGLEEKWRNHFATLSDEELKALDPEDLCASQRDFIRRLTRAYNEERARRELD